MSLKTQNDLGTKKTATVDSSKVNEKVFSKAYVDFLSDAGWKLEKKLPSNNYNYSDLLEDTDWESNKIDIRSSKHYRRDLDALS